MARASQEVFDHLKNTIRRISNSSEYQWGHMGTCNCGFLVQEVTHLKKSEIHARAMERHGDWNEQLNDYCPTSGLRIDDLVTEMLSAGFDIDDLKHLERLSDPRILEFVESDHLLKYNCKDDVILYLNAWATLIEMELLDAAYAGLVEPELQDASSV